MLKETRPRSKARDNVGRVLTCDGAMDVPPAKADPATHAFFLDLDGTLLDLAATPDAVAPEPWLGALLARLEDKTDGALAIVTGREIAFVDRLFPQHRFTVAGLHGAEFRPSAGIAREAAALIADGTPSENLGAALAYARAESRGLTGVLVEDKTRAFALHYRLAPAQRERVEAIMGEALALAGAAFQLRHGKAVVELCPKNADKGLIVRNLMCLPPFTLRRPVAAGDDLTDEAMFAAVNEMNGLSIRVALGDADRATAAMAFAATPTAFRHWLRRVTEGQGEKEDG